MKEFLWVGMGAWLGGVSRYYMSRLLAAKMGTLFPYGTFFVNVLGCLLIGFLSALAAKRVGFFPPELRLLVAVGFIGAFTTFSTFGYETIQMVENGSWAMAATYVVGSVVVGLLAVYLGVVLARAWVGAI